MVYPSKLSHPSVNLVTQELLLDRDGSLKIGVMVAEDWPTWKCFLPSLGYQVLQIYPPEMFRKLLQGGKLSGAKWLPPNQARRIRNLQDSCFCVLFSTSFVRQLWGGGISRDRMSVLMYVGSRVRNFRVRYGSWRLVHHYRVGGATTNAAWVVIWAAFGNPSMEDILRCRVPSILNTILDTKSKMKTVWSENSH